MTYLCIAAISVVFYAILGILFVKVSMWIIEEYRQDRAWWKYVADHPPWKKKR